MKKKVDRAAESLGFKISLAESGTTKEGKLFVMLRMRKQDLRFSRVFAVEELARQEGAPLLAWLAELGLPLVTRKSKTAALNRLQELIGDGRLSRDRLVVAEPGWSRGVFVTRYRPHCPPGVDVLDAVTSAEKVARGSATKLREALRIYGRNNPLVKFAFCVGLSGPLLEFAELVELPFFLLVGPSSNGKSSLLKIAVSSWGGPSSGVLGGLSSLSATTNAAELNGLGARDMIVAYDDLQMLSAERSKRAVDFRDLLFRSVGGRERGRLGESPREWRTVFMAASNQPLAEIMTAGGVRYDDAMGVRAIEVEAKRKFGVFDAVAENVDPSEFADGMVQAFEAQRGIAGETFAKSLVRERAASETKLRARVRRYIKEFVDHAASVDAVGGIERRILEKFGLVYAAGRIARSYGLVPWRKKSLLKALLSVSRGGPQVSTADQAVDHARQLATSIANLCSAFRTIKEGKPASTLAAVRDAAGVYYKRADGQSEYCFTAAQLRNIFPNEPLLDVQRGLSQAGLLKVDRGSGDKSKSKRRLVSGARARYFCIDRAAVQRLLGPPKLPSRPTRAVRRRV